MTVPRELELVERDLTDALEVSRARGAMTRYAAVRPGIMDDLGGVIGEIAPSRRAVVVHDGRTLEATDGAPIRSLERAGVTVIAHQLRANGTGDHVQCTDSVVAQLAADLRDAEFDHVVAVGSGTVTDLSRMLATVRSCPLTSVATAPSMNGYTSRICAIVQDGLKMTMPAIAPIIAIADPHVLAGAPLRMIASGLGDLYSKPVSNADWHLSRSMNGSPWDAHVAEMLETASTAVEGIAPLLPRRDVDACARLQIGLYLTGLAMQTASKGTQASGAEHLISHYLDIIGASPEFDHHVDLHGCQVAVGTVAIAALCEHIVDTLPPAPDRLPWVLSNRENWSRQIHAHFRSLGPSIERMWGAGWPDFEALQRRQQRWRADAKSIVAQATATWTRQADLEATLAQAGCPTRFSDIGLSRQRTLETLRNAPWVRSRFTSLHLALELDVLDDVADELALRLY